MMMWELIKDLLLVSLGSIGNQDQRALVFQSLFRLPTSLSAKRIYWLIIENAVSEMQE